MAATEDPDFDAMLGQLSAQSLGAAADAAAGQQQAGGAPQQPGGGPQQQQQQPQQPKKEDFKHYISLYPCYVNPKLTVAQGRRLPLHLVSGCDDPWVQDLAEACGRLGVKRMVLEGGKRHPRDQWPACQPARLRVELKDAAGAPQVPGIASKDALLRKMAPLIPGLPSRLARIEHLRRQHEQLLAQQAAQLKAIAAAPKKKEEAAGGKAKGGKGKK